VSNSPDHYRVPIFTGRNCGGVNVSYCLLQDGTRSCFSYRPAIATKIQLQNLKTSEILEAGNLERVKGIEPSYAAWEAAVLPLNYTRAHC
jgi:hypothetical protein